MTIDHTIFCVEMNEIFTIVWFWHTWAYNALIKYVPYKSVPDTSAVFHKLALVK